MHNWLGVLVPLSYDRGEVKEHTHFKGVNLTPGGLGDWGFEKSGWFFAPDPPPRGGAFPKLGVANFGRYDGGHGSGTGGARV